MPVVRLRRVDVFVAEHVLNNTQVGVAPTFSRELMARAVHVHAALDVRLDEAGSP